MGARRQPWPWVGLAYATIVAANLLLKVPAIRADGIWLDESLSLHLAQAPVSLATLAANEPTPPLYYLLLCAWVRVFGLSLDGARLLSVLLSTATALLLFDLARRHLGLATALIATALFTASRLQLYYAQEARTYALVGLLCVASFDLFLALAARPAWRTALALGVVNAALMYTHDVAVFALVAQALAALPLARRRRSFLPIYVASQALALLLFAPWLAGLLREGIARNDWIGPPTPSRVRYVVKRFAGSSTLLVLEVAVLVVVAAVSAARRGRAPARFDAAKVATLALWAFLPIVLAYAASFVRQMLVDRYLLYASLGLYLLVAYAIARAPLPRSLRALVALVAIALSLHGTLVDPIRRHDWRTASAVVREELRRGSGVVVASDWQFRPLAYYLDAAAFADYAHTRQRIEDDGVVLARDVRTLHLAPRRTVLVLGPEVPLSGAEGVVRWLEEGGFAVVRRADLHGLTLLVAEPRGAPVAAGGPGDVP